MPQAPQPGQPVDLGAVLGAYPSLASWVEADPANRAALERVVERVRKLHTVQGVGGFVALASMTLQGGGGQVPGLTPEQLRTALEDWCDTDNDGSKNSLRAFLRGALPKPGKGSEKQGGKGYPKKPTKLTTE